MSDTQWLFLAVMIAVITLAGALDWNNRSGKSPTEYTHHFYTCCGKEFKTIWNDHKYTSIHRSFYCTKHKEEISATFHVQEVRGNDIYYVMDRPLTVQE